MKLSCMIILDCVLTEQEVLGNPIAVAIGQFNGEQA